MASVGLGLGRGCASTRHIPEPTPRLPALRKRATPVVVLGPVGRRQRQWVDAHLGAVEELVHAPYEVPPILPALVGVAVDDGLMDPPVAVLDLGLAVDLAGGVVVVN